MLTIILDRLIKWEHGASSPKILTINDFEDLKDSKKLIARKFDIDVDLEIIEKLKEG